MHRRVDWLLTGVRLVCDERVSLFSTDFRPMHVNEANQRVDARVRRMRNVMLGGRRGKVAWIVQMQGAGLPSFQAEVSC